MERNDKDGAMHEALITELMNKGFASVCLNTTTAI